MRPLAELLARNRAWAAAQTRDDPRYFRRLSEIQRPRYLWIGCADSRVPANEIVGLPSGEVFVHRNVANLVRPDDPNCMAAVQYAVEVLGVRDIIVCGHYGCGGVRAALDGDDSGFVGTWLAPLRRLARENATLLSADGASTAWDRLCEMSVVAQVRALAGAPMVQMAWAVGQPLTIHGWIYSISDGLLRDLDVSFGSEDAPSPTRAAGAAGGP